MSMRDNIDKAFMENGVTANDLNTSAYERIKRALEQHPEIAFGNFPETVERAIKEGGVIIKRAEILTGSADLRMISDRDTIDAILAYRFMLQNTLEVFGEENMTENIMIKAIEAASYTAYRSIMGQAAQARR